MSSLVRRLLGVLFLTALPAFCTADGTTGVLSRSFVKPIDFSSFEARYQSLPSRDRELIDLYMKGAQRYVLSREDGAFPDKGTEHWRNLAERAHGAAVLAAMPGNWPADLKARCRREAADWVKSFTAEFKRRNDLGNPWQCSWWAGEMGAAAWFVWDQLEPDVQNDAAEMIIYHADRIAAQKPGSRVEKDTEAETVSWNSTVLSLAVNMLPGHPHWAAWDKAAKRYAYTVLATAADLKDSSPGDDGIAVKDWAAGANLHDDYSLENHNRFHIEYVFSAYRFLIQDAAMYRAAGREPPRAFAHHAAEVHEQVLCPCMDGSKFAVFVSDNDWKRYHLWTESPVVHGYVALMTSSPLASALEEQALRSASTYWSEFPEGFQYDNAYVCGKAWSPRIADIVLLHLMSGGAPQPAAKDAVEAALEGVHRKRDVKLVSQYSRAGSFRSFFGGPGPVVRFIEPTEQPWMLLPLETNYRILPDPPAGKDKGKGARAGAEPMARMEAANGSDWFWVLRSDARGIDEAFVSLPDEAVVMMTRASDAAVSAARTLDFGVGIEKPHRPFTIYYDGGSAGCVYGGQDWVRTDGGTGREVKSRWVNLGDAIGYVTTSSAEGKVVLPKAGARGSLSVWRVEDPEPKVVELAVAAFPNQAHEATARAAESVAFENTPDGRMTCRVGDYFVCANFSDAEASVELSTRAESSGSRTEVRGGTAKCPARSCAVWRAAGNGANGLKLLTPAGSAGSF